MNLSQLAVKELAKRGLQLQQLYNGLFGPQKEAAIDQNTFVACQCSRRSGKSYLIGTKLLAAAIKHPGSIVPYIALTRKSAKYIMWPILRELVRKHDLNADLREHDLTVKINGSEIVLFGADQSNWIERLRGAAYPFVAIDEAASFREHLKELVEDVLTPAIVDYNGQIYLVGSPGIVPKGAFYDATEKSMGGWSVHKWTILENPHMPGAPDFLAMVKEKRGWTDENPTYRREWLNEWVVDLEALVYRFNVDRNVYRNLPSENDYSRVLGVDFGWHDQAAFSIVCYSDHNPKVYVEHCTGFSHMIPSQIAFYVQTLVEKYKPVRIVADTGGLGKSITEEMIQRFQLPIQAAQKTEKMTAISLMNGDFIDGNIFVHESLKKLHQQYGELPKDSTKAMEDPNFSNDLCDATLYAWREAKGWAHSKIPKEPKTQRQRWDLEAQKMLEKDLEELENAEQNEWWEQ